MHIRLSAALAALLVSAASANAVVYDLAADFSNASNPNGPWSYGAGLTHYPQPSMPNDLNAAAGNGYWGGGAHFFVAPFVVQVSQDGSATGPYVNGDFLTDDVVVHGYNDGSTITISWTAPGAGTISFDSAFWYAHSIVQRSQDVAITLDGAALGGFVLTNGVTRSSAFTLSDSGLAVDAGDVLAFSFTKTAGQQYGSLSGISATIDFTSSGAIPEPASWVLMIGGLALVGGTMRRRTVAFA